ncbi:hypothetical protein [Turicibacter sp. TJ11]|uniref:hypothetical protein n=1 Tax=Turicibacter sp. TJ11 TaxID=2806443 RepID=UPI001F2EE40D|nr:hypothetical protein [Turicibacter sp. TJ11]
MIDKFLVIEEKYNFWDRNIEGFHYWAYIRRTIYESLYLKRSSAHDLKKLSLNDKLLILKDAVINLLNIKFLNENKDIVVRNHPRKIKAFDTSDEVCIYTELLIQSLSKDNLIIMEKSYQGKHVPRIDECDVMYMDFIDIITYITSPILKLMHNRSLLNLEIEMIDVINILENELNLKINPKKILLDVKNLYIHYKIKYFLLNKILNKINPRLIIEVVHYNFENMIINEIAKKKNIRTIELQHGILGKKHINYNYSKKRIHSFFPDEIFLFSEYWKYNTRLPIDDSRQHIVGFPYIEKYVKNNNLYKKRECILFISQATIGYELSKLAVQLGEELRERNLNYKIIYKLHPAEYLCWKVNYPWLYENSDFIEVIDYNINIYNLFEKSFIQIGVYSTALYEGLAFDLETYILNMSEADFVSDLYTSGYAVLINNISDIIYLLKQLNVNKTSKKNHFWSQDALEKMIQLCK